MIFKPKHTNMAEMPNNEMLKIVDSIPFIRTNKPIIITTKAMNLKLSEVCILKPKSCLQRQ